MGTIKNLLPVLTPERGAAFAVEFNPLPVGSGRIIWLPRLVLLFVNHVFACLWYLIGIAGEGPTDSPNDMNLV